MDSPIDSICSFDSSNLAYKKMSKSCAGFFNKERPLNIVINRNKQHDRIFMTKPPEYNEDSIQIS